MKLLRCSLKLRLTILFTLMNLAVLAALAVLVYGMVGARMRTGLDQELKRDFEVISSALEFDRGKLEWELAESGNLPGFDFEARDRAGGVLMAQGEAMPAPRPWPTWTDPRFFTYSEAGRRARVRMIEGVIRIDGQELLLRAQRSLSDLGRTLTHIVGVFALTMPVAVVMAGMAGYYVAGRSLAPINAIRRQAARISAHSLNERLPVANPDDEVGRLVQVFNETFERLEHSFDELRRFTADASHELRTPLTALRVAGEVALKQDGNAEAKDEAICTMLEEGERLNDLIVLLLELARGDDGTALETEKLRPEELLDEIAELLDVLAREREVHLQLDVHHQCTVIANRQLLRQAAMNLVHNAIHHSPPGKTIGLRTSCADGWATIEVRDQGPGIAPDHQDRVFDRFYRIDKSRSRAAGGFGLGLSIARQAVERMGGRISLNSEAGRGARFVIHLPLAD